MYLGSFGFGLLRQEKSGNPGELSKKRWNSSRILIDDKKYKTSLNNAAH
jgi:hypothetical protein